MFNTFFKCYLYIELRDNMNNLAFKFNIERPSCNRVKNLKF